MRFLGLEITVRKAAPLQSVDRRRGGWWPIVREPYTGAWQQNVEWTVDSVLAHHAVFSCVTLIASDIAKLRPKLVQQDADGIWSETTSPAFSPVLRKPNDYQNRIQFYEFWTISKLTRGNTYALKVRDSREVVTALHILDPSRVEVLVSEDGRVFYRLMRDNLAGVADGAGITVPASEIIHDRVNCLYHPLVGLSPITACGLAATVGLNIEQNAAHFFGKGSNPSGTISAPTHIDNTKAQMISDRWNAEFSGENSGRVAVLGDGMKFEPMRMSAIDAQMIETLKMTAETVASAFHVPAFKIGVGQMPTYQNGETLNGIYYSDCLQAHIEALELALDEGLGLTEPKDGGKLLGVEFDLDGLLRMDTATQVRTLAEAVKGSIMVPNEARLRMDLAPKEGGDSIWMQQQNYSLEALAERDRNDPFAKPAPAPAAAPPAATDDEASENDVRSFFQRRAIEKAAA